MDNNNNAEINALIRQDAHLNGILQQLSSSQKTFVTAKAYHVSYVDVYAEFGPSISIMRHWPASIRNLIRQAEALTAQDFVGDAL